MKPTVRNPWERVRVPTIVEGESMTSQVEKDIADVNNIVRHFARTGAFPAGAVRQIEPQYADVSEISHLDRAQLLQRQKELNEKFELERQRIDEINRLAETEKHVEIPLTPGASDQLPAQDSESQ